MTNECFNLAVNMLHPQMVSICERLVTMEAAEWLFVMTRHFIPAVIILHSQNYLSQL